MYIAVYVDYLVAVGLFNDISIMHAVPGIFFVILNICFSNFSA